MSSLKQFKRKKTTCSWILTALIEAGFSGSFLLVLEEHSLAKTLLFLITQYQCGKGYWTVNNDDKLNAQGQKNGQECCWIFYY